MGIFWVFFGVYSGFFGCFFGVYLGFFLGMCRRKTLAALGAATGVYRTLVSFLVGVPQVRDMGDGGWGMGEGRGGWD